MSYFAFVHSRGGAYLPGFRRRVQGQESSRCLPEGCQTPWRKAHRGQSGNGRSVAQDPFGAQLGRRKAECGASIV